MAGTAGATPFGGHAGWVQSVHFSPDGTTLASGGDDGTVRLWDTSGRRQRAILTGHSGWVRCVAFNSDGLTLASGGDDGTVRLWDVTSGEQIAVLLGHSGWVRSVAFSPDGTRLASAGKDEVVRMWHAASGEPDSDFLGQVPADETADRASQATDVARSVQALAFSPDGTTLASGGDDGTIRLWDARSGVQRTALHGHARAVRSVAYSTDGSLASGGDDGIIRLWDASGEQLADRHGGSQTVRAVAFGPGGLLASGGDDGVVRLWDTGGGESRGKLAGHADWVRSVAFSTNGLLASGGDDGVIKLWDASSGEPRGELRGHTGTVRAVAFSPDGATLASGGDDGKIRLWNAGSGEQVAVLAGHSRLIRSVAFSPDGAILASGGDDGTVRLWDIRNQNLRDTLSRHGSSVQSVAFSPGGMTLASSDEDGSIRLWTLWDGKSPHGTTPGRRRAVLSLAFAPDGTTLASGGQDGSVSLWDARSIEQRSVLPAHADWVRSVAFGADGTLASGGDDGTVRLWDAAASPAREIAAHAGRVRAVAFNRTGTFLASGGDDGLVRLWDARSGAQLFDFPGHTGPVHCVTFSKDGTIASAGEHTIRIWDARTGKQISGTGVGAAQPSARRLPGVRNDSPSPDDLLGIQSDVETLGDLIAASETRPPLAIALIGDWGAGKSSLLMQVERRIRLRAARSRNNPGGSGFAASVEQVYFNAWHYSDDHLWAGLVTRIFRTLAAYSRRESEGADSAQLDAAALSAERTELQSQLAHAEDDARRITEQLDSVDGLAQPAGIFSGLRSPYAALRVTWMSVRQVIRDARQGLPVLLGWVALAAICVVAWIFLATQIAAIASAASALIAPLLARGKRGHDTLMRFVQRERDQLDSDKARYEQQAHELKRRLLLIDAAARLAEFLDERGSASAYQQYRGLLGQVHDDLVQLDSALKEARAEWQASQSLSGPPPLERIVLYIDDLDRCPPRRVVEVLEAVHLMLALDLFVVVVAVDARWLIRSLEYHHRELFRMTRQNDPEYPDEMSRASPATPIDYLDKIFQIPYTVLPPQAPATERYLRGLGQDLAGSAAPGRQRPAASPASHGQPDDPAGSGVGSPDMPTPDNVPDPHPGQDTEAPETGKLDTDKEEQERIRDLSAPSDESQRFADALDLRPARLQLTPAEIEFMTRLAPLVPTPRAGKRLVNLYRLVRIGIPEAQLGMFLGGETGGPYQAVQVLLAGLCGYGDFAHVIFRRIMLAPPESRLLAALSGTKKGEPDHSRFAELFAHLAAVDSVTPLPALVSDYQRWCPSLARYSFHTRDLVGPPPELTGRG